MSDVYKGSGGTVLIFKGDDDSNSDQDPYLIELEKLGLNCKIIPALKFEFINSDRLVEKLSQPQLYSGIIFSSPRCVEAVKKCSSLKHWSNHKIYCVGSKTASLVREMGLEPIGEQSGNAQALANFILSDNPSLDLPLLLPQGNLSLKTFNTVLTSGGLSLDSIEIYMTMPNPVIEEAIKNYFKVSGKIDFAVYMSPSAVDASLSILSKYQHLSTIKFVTLGPTTASSLLSSGVKAAGVAVKPSPRYLADVMLQLLPMERS